MSIVTTTGPRRPKTAASKQPRQQSDLNGDGGSLTDLIPACLRGVRLQEVYETERHLLYVACTRARDHLLLTEVAPKFLNDQAKPQSGGKRFTRKRDANPGYGQISAENFFVTWEPPVRVVRLSPAVLGKGDTHAKSWSTDDRSWRHR